jgi:2'-hydroxyisoflavone reductase
VRILVLGGTVFLGRHLVEVAVARGHDVTLFNRGQHNAHLFPTLKKLRGNRDGDLSALRGKKFDAVIDPSGYRPEQIRAVASALESPEHYTFISSISVYARFPPGESFDEDTPLASGHEGYGPLKARSEEEVAAALPNRSAIVRPSLIVGPHDPTDRFTYWPRRIARGGHVLAPGRPDRPVQFVDVRDLADWCVALAEARHRGIFNAVGPAERFTMGDLLDECCRVAGRAPRFTWVTDDELVRVGATPWTELPLWIPEADPDFGGMLLADCGRALAAGLRFRPVGDTIRAILEWDHRREGDQSAPSARAAPITPEREGELLERVARRL